MAPIDFGQGTQIIPPPQLPVEEISPKKQCRLDGGVWDAATQTCLFPPPKQEPIPTQQPELPSIKQAGRARAGAVPTFRTTLQGDRFDINLPFALKDFSSKESYEQAKRITQGQGVGGFADTGEVGISQIEERARAQRKEGQALAGQVGQFGQLGVSPTGLDVGEALTTGIVGSIPSALRLAGQFGAGAAVLGGAATAPVGGVGAIPAAAIGAAVGFVAGIVGGMTSNFKSQRSDTTTAQQRILDEGKQTMKDWATLAKNDPANKTFYLAEYNKQSAQINQAYRQMKLDTSRDLAKFETALPNLAEFEAFYSAGGERDTLDIEMRNSLLTISPENYEMLELTHRRTQ